MKTNLYIAWRFITSKKRSMILSLLGVVFGVGFFIVTQAQTSGFENFFIKTILSTNGAIRIAEHFQSTIQSIASNPDDQDNFRVPVNEGKQYIYGIEYPHMLKEELTNYSEISGISEILEGNADAKSGFRNQPAKLMGIRLEDHATVSDLPRQVILGDIADYASDNNSVLLGSRLAKRLNLTVNDYVYLNTHGQEKAYRVSGIVETGISDIDKVRVYMHLSESRSLLKQPFGGSIFQISLFDPSKAPQIAAHIESSYQHHAASWQEREQVWLDVFKALRVSAGITVFTIILISGLGIFNTLVMIVMEKTKEIAILRSMGYTRKDISSIFLLQGGIVLVAGTVLGWIFAAFATYGISKIPLRIRGIFSTDSFVVHWSLSHYIMASVLALIVVITASYIPARRAAKLEPGDIVRGTSA
ncbi:MAG: ABC transporter permease [Verrucomicrobia bacterium CG_4_10_14_3_um_filter_43_23]|nr:MAG: ABC transporter permease [Verrucomicrobia bacterium CG1_02_43_26]PIP59645.1 MAG: ABC transporter permease [Verrucomicrobia bacterium CG22_combo_CG10-13_8_21_14_all_43_17]PIX58944.1 MAG: ABC transporter permease [Verrucomicrobia bacterium CG_4_10_14_3_um_filter_43_23]PIY63089.1 MAG: ABC transporter permease [Verrucomicrobia bacterium CG_4_10_14_0_8_um_filter_43_34]PJA43596.1 MAG: ABC transporter permease [Verrucomicrobia bacterium CG_4_9_14_3_um_filter_43_20]